MFGQHPHDAVLQAFGDVQQLQHAFDARVIIPGAPGFCNTAEQHIVANMLHDCTDHDPHLMCSKAMWASIQKANHICRRLRCCKACAIITAQLGHEYHELKQCKACKTMWRSLDSSGNHKALDNTAS